METTTDLQLANYNSRRMRRRGNTRKLAEATFAKGELPRLLRQLGRQLYGQNHGQYRAFDQLVNKVGPHANWTTRGLTFGRLGDQSGTSVRTVQRMRDAAEAQGLFTIDKPYRVPDGSGPRRRAAQWLVGPLFALRVLAAKHHKSSANPIDATVTASPQSVQITQAETDPEPVEPEPPPDPEAPEPAETGRVVTAEMIREYARKLREQGGGSK